MAGRRDLGHLPHHHHRAGADQQAVPEGAGQPRDAVHGVGGVQRDLDNGKAVFFQRGGDGFGFGGRDAAQDGDQGGSAGEMVSGPCGLLPDQRQARRCRVAVVAFGVASARGDGGGIELGQLRRTDHVHHGAV